MEDIEDIEKTHLSDDGDEGDEKSYQEIPGTPGTSATNGVECRAEFGNETSAKAFEGLNENANASSVQISNYAALARLITEENREMLDTVSSLARLNIKKSVISLPQLVVCGDQSTGKSSVLEAATGIAFPRKSGLCTRFPTEISLRRDDFHRVQVQINPHPETTGYARQRMENFSATITDLRDLPQLIEKAQVAMGLGDTKNFAKDVLCIEISGPNLPHLTLVDLPGLIKNAIDGISEEEVALVNELTDEYIQQPRAICLPVISATHDFANQGIVGKVQTYDPSGSRTLGIVTKPDKCEPGGGESKAAIALVQNKRVPLKLGWHVLRNRNEDETNRNTSNHERNLVEKRFFRQGGWPEISEKHKGAEALSVRLSELLIKHTKRELPKVRQDVEAEYTMRNEELEAMGKAREDPKSCRDFLFDLSSGYDRICKAAVDGHYEGSFFKYDDEHPFDYDNKLARRRLRAMIEFQNKGFSDMMRVWGHKYHIESAPDQKESVEPSESYEPHKSDKPDIPEQSALTMRTDSEKPILRSYAEALEWVGKALVRSHGRELQGNFNPLLIGELFWEQASKWDNLSREHLNDAFNSCSRFLKDLLDSKCPSDVTSRVWTGVFEAAMRTKKQAAISELQRLMDEIKNYPINYNHYYTDLITRNRMARQKKLLKASIEKANSAESKLFHCGGTHEVTKVDADAAERHFTESLTRDMDEYSCEGILDCMRAIYKVHQKTFVANVTTQVVERHIVRGLEDIFSPKLIANMGEDEVVAIASEPVEIKSYRAILQDDVKKLAEGREFLREIMRTAAQD